MTAKSVWRRYMRLMQPPRIIDSPVHVPEAEKLRFEDDLLFVKFRYAHHAGPSGYDRICDYIEGETVRVGRTLYWLGETALRPYCLWQAKTCGKYEYSRYDCVQELQFLYETLRKKRDRFCHFIYAEKTFHLAERRIAALKKRGHKMIGTVHHMPYQIPELFRSTEHFKAFDLLFCMDASSIPFWNGITGKDNVRHVPHGVDCSFFHPGELQPDRRATVVFAGSHERDLEALESVIYQFSKHDVTFILLGRSDMLKKIEQKCANTIRYDYVDDAQYASLLRNSTMLLLPLLGSTVCNVVLEAQASGLPVVTTKGGIDSYLEPSSSHVVPVGDVAGLVEGVNRFLSKEVNFRIAARRNSERFSWQEVARKHLDWISKSF
jgi:glycosyltransferase involved in cell wall biosynthesis